MDARELIEWLKLSPHPEGGYYRETYRAVGGQTVAARGPGDDGRRAFGTAIYFLITAEDFSSMHRVASDEVFHFYAGDPVLLYTVTEEGVGLERRLGLDVTRGEQPQLVVPAATWQGLRVAPGGRFALLGATVAPGFDFRDFTLARADELLGRFPQHAESLRPYLRG